MRKSNDVIAGAVPPGDGHVLDGTGELNPQKYGMDAVADLSECGEGGNAHEGVEP
jgi:hypothetical protein